MYFFPREIKFKLWSRNLSSALFDDAVVSKDYISSLIYYETLWKYSEKNPFQCHLVHHKSHKNQIPCLRSERPWTNHVTHGTVFERKETWIYLIEHGPIRDESQNWLENWQYTVLLVRAACVLLGLRLEFVQAFRIVTCFYWNVTKVYLMLKVEFLREDFKNYPRGMQNCNSLPHINSRT